MAVTLIMLTLDQKSAIIIFGAAVWVGGIPSPALVRRIENAIRIAAEIPEAYFIVTGGMGSFPSSEAEIMRRELIVRGIQAAQIYTEQTATNTLDSVLRVVPILSRLTPQPHDIYVVTDTYHQWRCRLLLFLSGVSTRHARLSSGFSSNGVLKWGLFYFREALAVPKDLIMLFIRRYL